MLFKRMRRQATGRRKYLQIKSLMKDFYAEYIKNSYPIIRK